jgi:histone deacetylase 1/2
MTQFHSDNYI